MVKDNAKTLVKIIMPAYREATTSNGIANFQAAIDRVEQEARNHPEYRFELLISVDQDPFVVPDHLQGRPVALNEIPVSDDQTYQVALKRALSSHDCYHNTDSIVVPTSVLSPQGSVRAGLASNLLRAYRCAIREREPGRFYTLKLDADHELDQGKIIASMIPLIEQQVPIAVGVRAARIHPTDNPLEARLQTYMHKVFDRELGLGELDPTSASVQLYRSDHLRELLATPAIADYPFSWGLDVQFDVTSAKTGKKPVVVQVDDGQYIPARRSDDKVRKRFGAYELMASQACGKDIPLLRTTYGLAQGDLPAPLSPPRPR